MRKFLEFFLKRPIWANAVIVITVLMGIYSLMNRNRSFFPEMDPRRIIVSTAYPGASPKEMEEGIAVKMEQALKGISGIEHIESNSVENFSTITIKGYQDTDMDELLTDVENSVNSINSFPDGAEKPIIRRLKTFGMGSMVAFVSFTCDCDIYELKSEADKIESDLLNSDEISEIEKIGFPEIEISIEVKEEELLRYGILFDEISNAVALKNQDITAGQIKTSEEEFLIRSNQRSSDVEEIKEIIVRAGPSGQTITIGDLADVKLQFSESSDQSYIDGNRSITFFIQKTTDQDITAISERLKEYIEDYNLKNKDRSLKILYEFDSLLQDRITLLVENGIMGLILVLIFLGLFLSLRLSFWVAFGIPFSFLGMFIIGSFAGITINMISLFGMIMVVGILVDDGIVIAENIYAHFERGKSPLQAALDGTMEVASSVFTSVLTTIVAFSLLLFVEGQLEMMREMAIVVIGSLAFSLIEAFFVLPSHLASKKVLSPPKQKGAGAGIRKFFEKIIIYLRDKVYGDILALIMRQYRFMVMLPLIFTIFIMAFLGNGVIKSTIFPEIKPDQFNIEVAFKPGERDFTTKAFLDSCEKIVEEVNKEVAEEFGDTMVSYTTLNVGSSEQIGQAGFHTGNIRVFLEAEGKSTPSDTIIERVRRRVMKLDGAKLAEEVYIGGQSRWGKPIAFALNSTNEKQLLKASKMFKDEVKKIEGIKNIKDNYPLGKNEILLDMKPQADVYNVGQAEISRQIRQGFFGQEAQRLIKGVDEIKIWVRYPEEQRESIGEFENLKIKTINGVQIPLKELASYEIQRGPVKIFRRDGKRDILIDADVIDAEQTLKINQKIENDIIPKVVGYYPDVNIEQRGQREEGQKTEDSLKLLTVIVLVIMTLIITMNFSSLFQGLLVILTIPAGVAGAILGHGIIGIPVSMLSVFGMVALIGVLVNDSVVFLDTYNRNLLENMPAKKAIFEAAKSRFRPILLTSLTTTAGLLPLIAETSFQAQFLIPVAVSIAFGVLFGTVFILLFFPAAVLLGTDLLRAWKFLWGSSAPPLQSNLIFFASIVVFLLSPLLILTGQYNKIIHLLWGMYEKPSYEDAEPALVNRRKIKDKES